MNFIKITILFTIFMLLYVLASLISSLFHHLHDLRKDYCNSASSEILLPSKNFISPGDVPNADGTMTSSVIVPLIIDSVLPSKCLNANNNTVDWRLRPSDCNDDIYLIWLVKSSIYRNSLRRNIRNMWGQKINYESNGIKFKTRTLFLVGSPTNDQRFSLISRESEKYDDILQGTFSDTFLSVTLKVFMGMKFVKEYCSLVQLIVIVDDDAMVLPWNLFRYIPPDSLLVTNNGHFYGGFFSDDITVVRDKNLRWYVSEEHYRCTTYPPYAKGTMLLVSKRTLIEMYKFMTKIFFFGMDDVLLGGIALELGINVTMLPFVNHYTECSFLLQAHNSQNVVDLLVCHGSDYPTQQELLWSEFCYASVSDASIMKYTLEYCKNIL